MALQPLLEKNADFLVPQCIYNTLLQENPTNIFPFSKTGSWLDGCHG